MGANVAFVHGAARDPLRAVERVKTGGRDRARSRLRVPRPFSPRPYQKGTAEQLTQIDKQVKAHVAALLSEGTNFPLVEYVRDKEMHAEQ